MANGAWELLQTRREKYEYGGFDSILNDAEVIMIANNVGLPGLLDEQLYATRSELHGFEVDMFGQVVVPEFHPANGDKLRVIQPESLDSLGSPCTS